MQRRTFLGALAGGVAASMIHAGTGRLGAAEPRPGVSVQNVREGEGIIEYVERVSGAFDATLYRQVLGAANDFKEGDQIVGVAATDEKARRNARRLLSNTTFRDIDSHPPHSDDLFRVVRRTTDQTIAKRLAESTIGALKARLIADDEESIKSIMPGLSSDVIGCVAKLMSNE